MQPTIKFEVFGQIISMNTDTNLPEAYIFRSVLDLYGNLLLILKRGPPVEASVGVCLMKSFGS